MRITPQANDLLQRRLNAYVETLQTVVAALGLDGEWRYDAATQELQPVEPEPTD